MLDSHCVEVLINSRPGRMRTNWKDDRELQKDNGESKRLDRIPRCRHRRCVSDQLRHAYRGTGFVLNSMIIRVSK